MMTKIFVYGTLKQGFPNNYHFQDSNPHGIARFICKAKTAEKYALIKDTERWNLPFLLNHKGIGHHVQGEVYEVDESMLNWLDAFEEVGSMYDVVSLEVSIENNEVLTCKCYVMYGPVEKYLKLTHHENYTQECAADYCEDDVEIDYE